MSLIDVEESSFQLFGDFHQSPACMTLFASFRRAMALDHKLPPAVYQMEGMSGRKYRYLVNTLIALTPDARYLEVGSWAGSTACSAMHGNALAITCIDNWSEFGGPKDVFLENVRACANEHMRFNFIESDFRAVDYGAIGRYNVYLFDGPHEAADQADGVLLAQPALDDSYTLIVDDWNAPHVRQGTIEALQKLGGPVVCGIEIRTTKNDTHPTVQRQHSEWHNGYFIAVCKKKPMA